MHSTDMTIENVDRGITSRLRNEYLLLEAKSKRYVGVLTASAIVLFTTLGFVWACLVFQKGAAIAFSSVVSGIAVFAIIYLSSMAYLTTYFGGQRWAADLSEAELLELANDETVDHHVLKMVSANLEMDGKVSNYWVGYYINLMATPAVHQEALAMSDGAKAVIAKVKTISGTK